MPYEIHAYCSESTIPTIGALLTHLRDDDDGPGLIADAPETSAEEVNSSDWDEFLLTYGRKSAGKKKTKLESLTLGCDRNNGTESMCAGMVAGQIEKISAYKDSVGKRRVIEHLGKTRYVIWCRVDNDPKRERGSNVLDFLAGLLYKYGAVFDFEGEGFLSDSDTPLCGWCNRDE